MHHYRDTYRKDTVAHLLRNIYIVNPLSLKTEHAFQRSPDSMTIFLMSLYVFRGGVLCKSTAINPRSTNEIEQLINYIRAK